MTQATTTTTDTSNGTNGTNTDGTSADKKRDPKPMTTIEAVSKIKRILDQLTHAEQKRVLAFVVDEVNGASA